MASANNIEVF